jgi:hypothetical protein
LEQKDRELREVSILRGEFIQQLDIIRNLLNKTTLRPPVYHELDSRIEQYKLDEFGQKTTKKRSDKTTKGSKGKKTKKDLGKPMEVLDSFESDRRELTGTDSYRERMILMNRIDIYRLFITVIIISSEIKYPRPLSTIEERELKMFIEELNKFENMVLDLKINENMIWDKGKTCEKQILQLFSNFFKV